MTHKFKSTNNRFSASYNLSKLSTPSTFAVAAVVPAMRFPVELVEEIAQFLYDDNNEEKDTMSKPTWSIIEPFTLVSKDLRDLTLRIWFSTFIVHTMADWEYVGEHFSHMYQWTRSVYCFQYYSGGST